MSKLAATSQGDLLRLVFDPKGPGLNDMSAELLGYERKPRVPVSHSSVNSPDSSSTESLEIPKLEQQSVPPEIEYHAERTALKFLMPTLAETLKVELSAQHVGDPVTNDELRIPWDSARIPHEPLIPWSKLGAFLKNRLGVRIPGARLDDRKLTKLISTNQPLKELPRLKRISWSPQAVILWDATPEMFPFVNDVQWLYQRLTAERGSIGLNVITLSSTLCFENTESIPAGTPVLAITAMGQFSGDRVIQSAWRTLNRRLSHRRHVFHALTPCPRNRWASNLASDWFTSAWDRGQRLPRQGGMTALPTKKAKSDATEYLLDALATASRIESPLLRAARLLMGTSGDSGTEWDAWNHSDCWSSDDCFGFRTGETYEYRLNRYADFCQRNTRVATKVSTAIQKHHRRFARTLQIEAELRAILCGIPNVDRLESVTTFLRRVVENLRLLADCPGSIEGRDNGLPKWFGDMVERLCPKIRSDGSVRNLIAQGLALAHAWYGEDQVIPNGVDAEVYAKESQNAALRIDRDTSPVEYIIGLNGTNLSFYPANEDAKPQVQLGRLLTARHGRLQIELDGAQSSLQSLQLNGGFHSGILLDAVPENVRITSSHGIRDFDTVERPEWAERLWYDQFGIAAEFTIRAVKFVLRWIPPGRFLMGSPKSENGRNNDEGPQHHVSISRGFWMGETPVTQEQWEATIETAREQPQLWKILSPEHSMDPKPSRMSGSSNLPVDNISWSDGTRFSDLIDRLLKGQQRFRLPTEAEWEYACRAGTQAAFHNGEACTVPIGLDPALESLGWFKKNSGSKTHPVKEKLPNSWGLYDMHGNIWEWCYDVWNPQAYKSRSEGGIDPVNSDGNMEVRVIRGGSWDFMARHCRAARRGRSGPGLFSYDYGFRLFAGQELIRAERAKFS